MSCVAHIFTALREPFQKKIQSVGFNDEQGQFFYPSDPISKVVISTQFFGSCSDPRESTSDPAPITNATGTNLAGIKAQDIGRSKKWSQENGHKKIT